MAKPTIYDVIVDNRKLGGAAQRRTKKGFLHQGTISLAPPPWDLLEKVLLQSTVFEAMQATTYTLLESTTDLSEKREEMQSALKQAFLETR